MITYSIMLCCNDDNGTTRKDGAEAFEFYRNHQSVLSIENQFEPPRRMVFRMDNLPKKVRIGRLAVPYTDYGSNVGNLYWDQIWVKERDWLDVLNYVRRSPNFTVTAGRASLFDAYGDGTVRAITRVHLAAMDNEDRAESPSVQG